MIDRNKELIITPDASQILRYAWGEDYASRFLMCPQRNVINLINMNTINEQQKVTYGGQIKINLILSYSDTIPTIDKDVQYYIVHPIDDELMI